MDTALQDTLAAIVAKETWTFEDHEQLLKELSKTSEAPRRMRQTLAQLESANPQPKGGAAMKIGIARFMLCRLGDSLNAFAEATDNKDRRYFQAMAFKAIGQYDKAIEELDRAKSKGWDALSADVQLIEILALKGNLEAARKALGKLKDKIADTANAYYLQGLIEELEGQRHTAADNYVKARQIDPKHIAATFHLAYYYDLHGEEEQALAMYKECRSQTPVYASALLNMSILYEDLGNYDRSIACLETILQNNPNHLRARLFLKDAQASMTMYYDEDQAKRVARRNAVLDIPVTDFELSVRARNCLKKMNIRTLGDLVATSEAELLAYKNFGETSLKEIKDMLTAKGLHLGQATEEGASFSPLAAMTPASTAAPAAAPTVNEGVLATPIERVEFSIRARRALDNLGVKCLGDLVKKSEAELLGCKNFGQTSLNEIRQKLAEYGVGLRESNA